MQTIPILDRPYPVGTVYTNRGDLCGRNQQERMEDIAAFLDTDIDRLILADETHSGTILVLDEADPDGRVEYTDESHTIRHKGGFDSMITTLPKVLLCVSTADCVPVFLYDPIGQVAAMVHSGWRGTLADIAANTVRVMERCFHTDPANVLAGIGPCICGKCYEVGAELVGLFRKRLDDREIQTYFSPCGNDKYLFDNKGVILRDLLDHGGLKEGNIFDTGICSFETDTYASYRRDGKLDRDTQTLSGIVLKETD